MSGHLRIRRALLLLAGLLVAGGLWQLGTAGWMAGKAALAQILLERAWSATLADGRPARPWPWADGYPVARLEVPDLGESLLVLDRANPRNLAFGPGRVAGSAPFGGHGLTIVAGHRDSHFAFLDALAPGERLRLQSPDGRWRDYRVVDMEVLDQPRLPVPEGMDGLALVTCWPLDALRPGGAQRYVVLAEPIGRTPAELAGRFPAPAVLQQASLAGIPASIPAGDPLLLPR
ncbi:sortase A [Tistlia consotensis]|uniref:Sortase A n=1 Tax=Tistlia consotensis USBA 355 TaxID=560819 RepID=A0A1Y6CLK0_9PROT|nr:class GN sortase [Tistlia consotensis]SMF75682.1 sortase A [Tistlia consotensis USBA 355]SNS07566.1 sortase A [Tistlia consotensis]